MKPKVNKNKCIGCGTCESVCPAVFKLNNEGKSEVKSDADCDKAGCCKEAEESCPVNAISL